MKKILFFLLLAGFSISVQAQFGVNAGLNVSTLSGNAISNEKSKPGLHIGAFYQHALDKGIAVQAEAFYSGEGVKYSSGNLKDLLNYLNLAAMFRYNFNGDFNLSTGPQYGILLSAKRKSNGGSSDLKQILKSNNFSWAFAAGYDLPLGVGFYARYQLGLSNIQKDAQAGDLKSGTFQLGIRYSFSMGAEE